MLSAAATCMAPCLLVLFLNACIIQSDVLTLSVFFAPARYMVVKIVCFCFKVVLRTMKNYKAHYNLSWFRPLLQGNNLTSSIFVIEEDEQCYNMGELRAQKVC
jgi:hypothetical protein